MAPAAHSRCRSCETSPPPIPSLEHTPANPSDARRFHRSAPRASSSMGRHKLTRPAGPSPVSSRTLFQVLPLVPLPAPAPSPIRQLPTTLLPLRPNPHVATSFFLPNEFG